MQYPGLLKRGYVFDWSGGGCVPGLCMDDEMIEKCGRNRKNFFVEFILCQRHRKKHPRERGRNASMDEKCWVCGADITSSYQATDIMSGRFCHDHWLEHTRDYKKTVAEYLRLKNVVMFERSMRKMENSGLNMTDIKREAIAVQKHSADKPELYKSSEEMIAAIIMLKAGIDFEMNYKIGKFIVDMFIPDWKVIVEIDGERHENMLVKDSKRDTELRKMLGAEWEVIRIPTKYIDDNPAKLPEAIKELLKHKKSIRQKNGGFLPQSYSKREAARYARAIMYDEIHVKA